MSSRKAGESGFISYFKVYLVVGLYNRKVLERFGISIIRSAKFPGFRGEVNILLTSRPLISFTKMQLEFQDPTPEHPPRNPTLSIHPSILIS